MRSPRARIVALAVGVGVIGSLAAAPASFATAPAAGVACNPSDGKISGRGSTFQLYAVNALANGYASDVCGSVAAQSASDPAMPLDPTNPLTAAPLQTDMLAYNYPASGASSGDRGSGAGRLAASCRTDAFGGTDSPYTTAQRTSINGAPGALGSCALDFTPPYTPAPTYPHSGDTAQAVMTLPIAGGSVAIGINLGTASCPTGTIPTSLSFTTQVMSKLIGGEYAHWSDLVADEPSLPLSNCTGPIDRVVRSDSSGTTGIFKTYLSKADGSRTLCDGVNTWTTLSSSANNTVWPTGGTCAIATDPQNGSPGVVQRVEAVDGAFGYSEYAYWATPSLPSNLVLASLTAADGSSQAPTVSKCNVGINGLPGSTTNDAVGLNTGTATWASDTTGPKVEDITWNGIQTTPQNTYPACGLTWDLVYRADNGNLSAATNAAQTLPTATLTVTSVPAGTPTSGTLTLASSTGAQTLTYTGTTTTSFTGVSGGTGTVASGAAVHIWNAATGAISGLTSDQRRTLYSFYSYVYSPLAQSHLNSANYDPLPDTWLQKLRQGFQTNF